MKTSLSNSVSELTNQPLFSNRIRAENVECPKCRKRTIIRRSLNTFDCLNCNFHRELPPITQPSNARRSHALSGHTLGHTLGHAIDDSTGHITELYANNPTLEALEESSPTTNKIHPLLFAAIAVILGIILL